MESIETYQNLNQKLLMNNLNIEIYQKIDNQEYIEAIQILQSVLAMSKRLNDKKLEIQANFNLSMCFFHLGKFQDSFDILENNIRIVQLEEFLSKQMFMILIQCLCYMILCSISINNLKSANAYLQLLESKIKSFNCDDETKFNLLEYANYCMFGINKISDIEMINNNSNEELPEDEKVASFEINLKFYGMLIKLEKFNYDFTCKPFKTWVNSFKEYVDLLKTKKMFNPFILSNVVLNECYLLTDNDNTSASNKLKALIKIMLSTTVEVKGLKIEEDSKNEKLKDLSKSRIDEKEIDSFRINQILTEFKEKITFASKLIITMKNLEILLINNIGNTENSLETLSKKEKENIVKKQIIKIYLNYVNGWLNIQLNEVVKDDDVDLDTLKDMKKQTEFSLNLLNEDIDIDLIDLNIIDKETFNSLQILYSNLQTIKYKFCIMNAFKKLKLKTLGYSSKIAVRDQLHDKFIEMMKRKMNNIRNGNNLKKLNYSSSGVKTHFYQVSVDEMCIKVFEREGAKSYDKIMFSDIVKFSYGVCSQNQRKKLLQSLSSDYEKINHWECFSLSYKGKTLDLNADEKIADDWYYGMKHIFSENFKKQNKYICSVTYFRFAKLKMKLLAKLKDIYEKRINEKDKDQKYYFNLGVIDKLIQKYKKNGLGSISFIEVYTMYSKYTVK